MTEIPLGPSLGQCCGGSISLLFEPVAAPPPDWLQTVFQDTAEGRCAVLMTCVTDDGARKHVVTGDSLEDALPSGPVRRSVGRMLDDEVAACRLVKGPTGERWVLEALVERHPVVMLFGAGHVGQALIAVLANLPFRVVWVDERPSAFPERLPPNVEARPVAWPGGEVAHAPSDALYLVMTHSHQRDLELCELVLNRGDFAYLGLIGSATKRARFEKRLEAGGLPEAAISRLICPIGIDGISGKRPAEIAVSVAAQLLQHCDRMAS